MSCNNAPPYASWFGGDEDGNEEQRDNTNDMIRNALSELNLLRSQRRMSHDEILAEAVALANPNNITQPQALLEEEQQQQEEDNSGDDEDEDESSSSRGSSD